MLGPKFGTIKSFYKNQMIFKEGQTGDVGYLVKTGEVLIYKIIDNEKKVLDTLGPGEVFGEMGLITDSPRTAFAQAKDYCDLVIIDKATLYKLLKQSPKMIQSITLILMKRLASTLHLLETEEAVEVSPKNFFSVCCLLDLANQYDRGINFHLFCNRAKDITCLNVKQVETILKRLNRLNIVEIQGGETGSIPPNATLKLIVDQEMLLRAAKHLD